MVTMRTEASEGEKLWTLAVSWEAVLPVQLQEVSAAVPALWAEQACQDTAVRTPRDMVVVAPRPYPRPYAG